MMLDTANVIVKGHTNDKQKHIVQSDPTEDVGKNLPPF